MATAGGVGGGGDGGGGEGGGGGGGEGGGAGGSGDALRLTHVSVLTQFPLSQLRLPDLVKSALVQAAVEQM